MEQVRPDAGPATVLSAGRVLRARVSSRPDTRHLAPEVDAAVRDLRARLEDYDERHDAQLAAVGAIAFADAEEDDAIADLARQVKVAVKGDLSSPLWRRLFHEVPSRSTRGVANEEQNEAAAHVLHTLRTDPEYRAFAGSLPALEAARAAVEGALRDQKKAEQAEERAWTELQLAEDAVRTVYRDTEPRLYLVFPGQRRLVDSFFYQPPKKTRKVV